MIIIGDDHVCISNKPQHQHNRTPSLSFVLPSGGITILYRSSSFLALRFANWVCTCTSAASRYRYLHAPYRRDGSSTTMTLTMEAAGAGGAEVIDLGLMLGVGWRRTCVRDALSQKCNSSCDRSIGRSVRLATENLLCALCWRC